MKGKLIKEIDNSFVLLMENTNDLSGILASTNKTNPEYTMGKLSLKNCQAIERGYDLDAIKKEFIENQLQGLDSEDCEKYIDFAEEDANIFIEGFQKALELMGDKKFSDGDIKKVIEISRQGSLQENHNGYGVSTGSIFVLDNLSVNEIIQSLQQTEWDVEVCTLNDCNGDYNLCYSRHFDCKICTNTGIPKLDANGCLILKRI